jgi:hypothetical protein
MASALASLRRQNCPRGGGHAAGDRPLACTRPHERRPRECVRQSGTGGGGVGLDVKGGGAFRDLAIGPVFCRTGAKGGAGAIYALPCTGTHCPRYAAPRLAVPARAHLTRAVDVGTSGALTPRPEARRATDSGGRAAVGTRQRHGRRQLRLRRLWLWRQRRTRAGDVCVMDAIGCWLSLPLP